MGAYRTAYEKDVLRRIASVAETALTPVERISLLGDELALVRQGRDTLADYLSLVQELARDQSGPVVDMLADRLDYVAQYLVPGHARAAYQTWVRDLLEPVASELGWNGNPAEPENQQERRATILRTLGLVGADPETLRVARDVTTRYLDGAFNPDPSLLPTAVLLAARSGDRALYDRMLARARTDPEPEEQQRFRDALGQFTDPVLIKRTIDLAFSDEVKSQDVPGLLGVMLSNPSARGMTWQFIKERWQELERRLLGVFRGIPGIVGATSAFCDPSARDDVRRFFEAHKIPTAERSLRQSLETIDACIALKNRAEQPLVQFLRQ